MHDDALPPCSIEPTSPPLIAPWWHTAAFLLLLAAWAAISGTRTSTYAHAPHPTTYISQVMMTWMLFCTVIAGIFDRGAFFFSTLRNRAQSFMADVASGLGIYVGFYACVISVVAVVGMSTMAYRSTHPAPAPTTKSSSDGATAVPPPAPEAPPVVGKSRFGFNSKTVHALAPTSALDLLLWIAVSFTAAFCEEHIFRGYLLTQARALLLGAGASTLAANIIAVAATSLIFGSLHIYEGLGGACLIASLGAVYAVCALKLGNLRAVIAAHFLQDFLAGLFFYLAHARQSH